MRAVLLICAVTVACETRPDEPLPPPSPLSAEAAPTKRRLELSDVAAEAPLGFVDLEPDRIERLRQAALRGDPTATAKVVGVRAPGPMLGGTVYIQSGDARRSVSAKDLTVKEALELEGEIMRQMMSTPATKVIDFTTTPKDNALEACTKFSMGQGDKVAILRLCANLFVRPDGRLAAQAVACMGESQGADALCNPVMESRKFTLDPSRKRFDEVLPANAKPLGFIDGHDVAGVVFGASVADFRAACKKAGHSVDQYDWALEIGAVKDWVKKGLMSKCSGLPRAGTGATAFDLGKVVEVGAIFTDNQIASGTYVLDAPVEEVDARVSEAYPDGLADLGMNVHVIAVDPKEEDDLLSVSVGPSRVRGAKTSVTFLSKRGMSAPPLPGLPPLPAPQAPAPQAPAPR
ncbi:MAG: hypothetical protein HOV80_19855 [Polyangiaceae bacterium]|nr:hypothetical protein [Polyangiaceae bacterium]